MQRKLAAIMAADIVGYSLLMAENETATYAELRTVFDALIDPTVNRHGGRTFKTTGDGFLTMFPSVNEAVDAAIAIQQGFDKGPFQLRIGINLGDVIEDNGDVYGDGVNVAARLEAMTEPGHIFVSGAVVMAAERNRGDLFAKVGRRRAKNIPELLNVYRVRRSGSPWAAWQRVPQVLRGTAARWSYGVAAVTLILIGTQITPLPLAAMVSRIPAVLSLGQTRTRPDPRPSVAVMPFATMSGSVDQPYFADGLTEDVTTALARNSELQVIARDSTYAVRGQDTDIRKLGAKLGVDYVIEGSARREGDQLRVSAQLIDVGNGAHLWSRSYDRKVADVFTVQSELTTEIVAQLAPYIGRSEAAAAAQRPTDNLQAYDLVLQARDRYRHGATDQNAILEARGLYQRALEMDPAYAAARAGLALTYIAEVAQRPGGQSAAPELDLGLSEARQAVRLDPNLGLGYQVISFGLALQADYSGGLQAAQRAVDLNPNDPDSMMALAKAQVRFGDYGDAVANAERARRLHPMAPEYYAYVHGQALYADGRRKEAATVIGECLVRAPRDSNCLLIQAALQGANGDLEKAQATLTSLIETRPTFSLEAERAYRRFGDKPLMDEFLQDLARAKAPETA
ncbi:adenylate/guanylate cyclase domain-containing protein [Phyllobacterium endophyticum]|uniref:Adenylate/guanylate cyclase domain-containing protein n=1 Tax=Phyllobacterium endophyticum TaxID=1149773 RepID=A0A2P7ASV3_9HYPH|nr:adenylate/guanylate cyclase domain-containing protein [Phyllobacterium endophyticum]MBB3236920.1 adenylate cyclase [Phyllobacterium endophyticum]PSH57306.1 adenylate/guanylate cyclase domain-containing protein [Phyllobacterium endophyticum]TYR40439.1 adenylate/guanylate cyclase domain-containing protein [Phyllobacterium endophyticum]